MNKQTYEVHVHDVALNYKKTCFIFYRVQWANNNISVDVYSTTQSFILVNTTIQWSKNLSDMP